MHMKEDGSDRLPSERDHMIERLQLELQKWKNRAQGWENAARNAELRYHTLKNGIISLHDKLEEMNKVKLTLGKGEAFNDVSKAEAATGSH